MENKKEEKKEGKTELRYSEACIEHRKKSFMPLLDEHNRRLLCDDGRSCYGEGCPLYKQRLTQDLGQGFKSKGTRHILEVFGRERKGTMVKNEKGGEIFVEEKRTPDNPLGINLEVYEEIKDEKPKKKITKEIEDFLWLQSRVIGKLAWKPQIWKALDDLSTEEILDRLLGGTGLEGVPKTMGGDMHLKASPEANKLFAKLEKEFAEEDEKKGKGAPPNYEDVGKPHGFFDQGIWVDKKEEKKDAKKTSKK